MQTLLRDKMVTRPSLCVEGKSHRLPFQQIVAKRKTQPLELIHSDVCGKIGKQSLGGAEYFVTFVDDCSRYIP